MDICRNAKFVAVIPYKHLSSKYGGPLTNEDIQLLTGIKLLAVLVLGLPGCTKNNISSIDTPNIKRTYALTAVGLFPLLETKETVKILRERYRMKFIAQ